jgi:hypothetical protein
MLVCQRMDIPHIRNLLLGVSHHRRKSRERRIVEKDYTKKLLVRNLARGLRVPCPLRPLYTLRGAWNGIKLSSNAPLINVLHVARCDRVAASGIGSACDSTGFDMGRSSW